METGAPAGREKKPSANFVHGGRNTQFLRGTNAIPIRLHRLPGHGQALPANPAKAPPIPCDAIKLARDRARERRQIPVDLSLTNYTWKSKSTYGKSGPLPSHIGQTVLEDLPKPVTSPKSKRLDEILSPEFLADEDGESDGENVEVENPGTQKRKGPPEAVARIGHVMKYRPRVQPQGWQANSYIASVTHSDRVKCLIASTECEFRNSDPYLEMIGDLSLENDLSQQLQSSIRGDDDTLYEPSADYEWIKPDHGHIHLRPRNVAKGASGHQTLTVKDVLQGALKLPIDSRRDGDQEYIGAIDNLGQRTPSAAFGHDLLIGNKQYTSSRFRGLCDMRVRLWAKENGYEMENPVDSMSNKPSGKPRAGTEDVHVHGKEERDEEDLFPATYWPPPPFNIFNRSERKDVQEVLSKSPDLPRNVPHELISFEQQVRRTRGSPPRPHVSATDEELDHYALHHSSSPGKASFGDIPHNRESIREETSKEALSDYDPPPELEEDDQIETAPDEVSGSSGIVHYHPAKPLEFPLSPGSKARNTVRQVMITVDWLEFPEVEKADDADSQGLDGDEMIEEPEPVKRRARAIIHTETVQPDEDCDSMPEALVGRKRNRTLCLVSVDDLSLMEEELGFYDERHSKHEKDLKMMQRHWENIRRTLSSAVMTCPETMRVHMVRYNLQSMMQQYKLDGLAAALGLVEGGEEFFFNRTLPHIVARAMTINELLQKEEGILPCMRTDGPGKSSKFEISRVLIAAILCNMFVCALPNNDFSFAELLCSNQRFQITKLCCYINYFARIAQLPLNEPKGNLLFVRSSIPGPFNWRTAQKPMTALKVHTQGQVYDEDLRTHLLVLPSFKNVGGGMLFRRCTPEETHMCNRPELSIAMMVAPNLGSFDALHIRGAERYNRTAHEGLHLKYLGNYEDTMHMDKVDEDGLALRSSFVAIDAAKFDDSKDKNLMKQISREGMQFDLDKAFVASRETSENACASLKSVSCGAWGAGAPYRGEQEVKVLLLWMAASANGKAVDYYSNGVLEESQARDLEKLVAAAVKNDYTVGDMYGALSELSSSELKKAQLFPFLLEFLGRDLAVESEHEDNGDEE